MKIVFSKKWLQDLAEGQQKGKQHFNKEVIDKYQKRIAYIRGAASTDDLRVIKSLYFLNG